jgi:putative ABC transport system permease protein
MIFKNIAMFISDIKAALRSVFRNKIVSAISILGLGIGLGSIILLVGLIVHETSFDTYMPRYNNVYRVISGSTAQTPFPLADAMASEFPEISGFFRYYQSGSVQIKNSRNEMIREGNFGFADSSIFRILGIKFLNGQPAESNSEVAISEVSAKKYFGQGPAVGKILRIKFTNALVELSVSGVYKELPTNSTLSPEFIADIKMSEKVLMQFQRTLGAYGSDQEVIPDWHRLEFLTYVELKENSDPVAVAARMEKYKEHLKADNKDKIQYRLQPVKEIYLKSDGISGGYFLRQGNPDELKYFEVISVIILIISLANYILLSRAGTEDRIHELGTRKVYGASFRLIRRLIMTESLIIVIISLVPAIFIIDAGIKFINSTLNKTLSVSVFQNPWLWIILIGIVFFTALFAGWMIGLKYSRIPALNLLSGLKPGSGRSGRWNYSFLLLHFSIYMILVTAVITVSRQIKYVVSDYKGINPENVFVADLNTDALKKSFNMLCNEMKKIPGVEAVAGGSYIPPFNAFLPINLAVQDGEKVRFDGLITGEGLTELLGIEVTDGSSFGPYKPGTPEILINESAAVKYNVHAGENILVFRVKGIVRDFHAHSMHSLIQPMVILQQNPESMGLIAVRTDGKNDDEAISRLKDLFFSVSPDEVFETQYLTEIVNQFYQRETNQLRIITAFSCLSVILAIMGLFGISYISISRRRKEIGIRKVNGASVFSILIMINTDFLKWVLMAAIISVPVSVWLLDKWLVRFAYRIDLEPWVFGAAVLSAFIIAILTVSWQSWRAATRNPVEALRYE